MSIEQRLNAGRALLRAGQLESAERVFRGCLAEEDSAAAWFYLGAVQHAMGQLTIAAASFENAITRAPRLTQAREGRAAVLAALDRLAEAEAELRAALEAGAAGQVKVNLAIVLERRGKTDEALALYDEALAADPSEFAARMNRGALRLAAGRPAEALGDFNALPDDRFEAHLNRARALFELHRDQEALFAAEEALRLSPRNSRAWLDRIIALASLGLLAESRAALAEARKLGIALTSLPGGPQTWEHLDAGKLYVGRAFARQWVCDWRDRDALVATLRSWLAEPLPYSKIAEPGILFHALSLPLEATEVAGLARIAALGVQERAKAVRIDSAQTVAGRVGKRFKVGFLCTTLREHPGSRLLRRIFLDRDRASFEYLVFALKPDLRDPVARDIQTSADAMFDMTDWTIAEIAERMRAERLDLLVDDGGYLESCRPELLAARVAPVQVEYLGTPSSLGPGIADYRLNDAFSTPPDWQPHWPEKLALMSHATYVFDTDAPVGDPGSRASHGLPRDGFVWCCFNQSRKIEPQVFDIWMRLMAAVPDSVLWLLDGGALTCGNLCREAEARGIAPGRLVFAPRVPLDAHFGRHAHADLFLDTLFFNAHTTALDALWGGVPILTRVGKTMASRVAGSFLNAAGLPELVVHTLEEYEAKALQIARDPGLLKRLKSKVAAAKKQSPLFDAKAGVAAFEGTLRAMIERHRAGLPPDTLIIG